MAVGHALAGRFIKQIQRNGLDWSIKCNFCKLDEVMPKLKPFDLSLRHAISAGHINKWYMRENSRELCRKTRQIIIRCGPKARLTGCSVACAAGDGPRV